MNMIAATRLAHPRFPFPPHPDGWYAVAWSEDVGHGVAAPAKAFGEDLVVFRDEAGRPSVLEAHCPHLGAHLGHGGTVVGGEVRCPFHGWSFATSGRCMASPGAKKLASGSTLRRWEVIERFDRIWVWHSDEQATPWPFPTTLGERTLRRVRAGRVDRTFASHPQDVIENAVDPAHFRFVHGMSAVLDSKTDYAEHQLTTRLEVRSSSDRFGIKGLHCEGSITVTAYGLGLQTVHAVVRIVELGVDLTTLVIEGVTPRGNGEVSLLLDTHMAPLPPLPGIARLAHRQFMAAVIHDVDADIQVWANRRYLDRPRLTAADGEIGRYRRWARRFYPANAGV